VSNIVTVNGWSLHQVEGSAERLILDVDLGQRLGYAKPLRDVQRVIESLVKDAELPGIRCEDRTVLTSMPRGGSREETVKAYYLTEREALKVIAKSRTPTAYKITNEIIDVYLVIKNASEAEIQRLYSSVVTLLGQQSDQIDRLITRIVELDSPQIKASEAKGITRRISAIAATRYPEGEMARITAFRQVENELRGRLSFPVASGHKWTALQRYRLGDVLLALDEMEAEMVTVARAKAKHLAKHAEQPTIDFDAAKRKRLEGK